MTLQQAEETTVTLRGVNFPVNVTPYVPPSRINPPEGEEVSSAGMPTWEDPVAYVDWLQLQGDDKTYRQLWPSTAPEEGKDLDEMLARRLLREWETEIEEGARGL